MKKIILAVAVAVLAVMAVASSASAGVTRYQSSTATLTLSVVGTPYVHTFQIETNPCDNNSFSGTGGIDWLDLDETVSGTLHGENIHINGEYLTYYVPYTWSYDGPLSGGASSDSLGRALPVTLALSNVTTTNYKNHGDFVSQSPNKNDSAHSCIGMPIS